MRSFGLPPQMTELAGEVARVLREISTRPFDPDALDRRDADLIRALMPIARWYSRRYVRLEVFGTENVRAGPAVFAANHSGGVTGPDLPCITGVLWERLGPNAPLYALAHDAAMRQFTPLGRVIQALGAVGATRDNARRILERGGSFIVFPGGDIDSWRHFRRRNEVVFGKRVGFVEVARTTGAPIVPVVIQGAHRSAIILSEGVQVAKLLRLQKWGRVDRFPVALALPWGIALGPYVPYLPLPFRIRMTFLEPVHVSRSADPWLVQAAIRDVMQRELTRLSRLK